RLYKVYAQPAAAGIGVEIKGTAGAPDRVANANTVYGAVTSMKTVAGGGTSAQRSLQITGPASDNGIYGSDFSPADIGIGANIGDGANSCRGNALYNVTLEGSAGATNYSVAGNCSGFWVQGFFTSAGGGTITNGASGWLHDHRAGFSRWFGGTTQ